MTDRSKFLGRMLDRLYASLLSGPGLNCRPHASRQRIDMSLLTRMQDQTPEAILLQLLGEQRQAKVTAKVPAPRQGSSAIALTASRRIKGLAQPETLSPEQEAALRAWEQQHTLLNKLRGIIEDARLYTQDTGVHVLNLGFPLLSVPAGYLSNPGSSSRRILAPIAFIPIQITAKAGISPSLRIDCFGEGADLVVPNTALLAWLEQQTGKSTVDLFADDEGAAPWRELRELTAYVCQTLGMSLPEFLAQPEGADPAAAPEIKLDQVPRAEESEKPTVLSSCVLGLFPMANQSLIRDTQEMQADQKLSGPVVSFLRVGEALSGSNRPQRENQRPRKLAANEHLVSAADPFQAQAVRLAREHTGLVIHGPPGTGKSQTIANIIGDHLARGERALLVCDKRTALDVVANRLQHLGLGDLCALVHDPQRDRRELYKGLRDQLDGLTEKSLDPTGLAQLAKVNSELQELHDSLAAYYRALDGSGPDQGDSFHNLVGRWLALPHPSDAGLAKSIDEALGGLRLDDLERHESLLREILQRGQECQWSANPWVQSAGIPLSDYLARSMDRWRSVLAEVTAAADLADSTIGDFPAFDLQQSVTQQAEARSGVVEQFGNISDALSQKIAVHWSPQATDAVRRALALLHESAPLLDSLAQHPLDSELSAAVRDPMPAPAQTHAWLAALDGYLDIAGKWYGFVYSSRRAEARSAMNCFGLVLNAENAARLKKFLGGLELRLKLLSVCEQCGGEMPAGMPSDAAITATISKAKSFLELLIEIQTNPALASLRQPLLDALAKPSRREAILSGMCRSIARAAAIDTLQRKVEACGLFVTEWRQQVERSLRQTQAVAPQFTALEIALSSLELVLRVRDGLSSLPANMASAIRVLLSHSATPEDVISALRRGILESEITNHIRRTPQLTNLDAARLQRLQERYRTLSDEKKQLTCRSILHRWRSRQKERLLASTGTRLNNAGTELRRRLMLRGERAMRLRQVIYTGQSTEGGDPLFDLYPVWMASPETVAQIFPRAPVFDVVIFDEASQCRLEEALAVLQRGRRVVIAGDPQQLPPTRFFEAAVAVSNEEEAESDQDLFEQQQSEIEDLLNAALNVEIEQCYLDVHYRSRDASLIQFSNEHFYESRLQPIPAHPSRRQSGQAIRLIQAGGTYSQQTNEEEAAVVCRLVRDLLSQASPPSIGIACFNIAQRDLILECLDRAAAEDGDFAARLLAARGRIGDGTFEGLFVKNLENVQGDERDHMIISTTYGPDPSGRFFRRFGPLGRSGGGRRLNVLVTRAREAVHLVTSIPPSAYRNLPSLPMGSLPSGAFLLFAYLQYAETVGESVSSASTPTPSRQVEAAVHILPATFPSQFAQALGQQLATQQQLGSQVHWGNDGFCIDVALQGTADPTDTTLGVLCDGPRFSKAPDAVDWDLFRCSILERQGWKLHRVWTPHFFRDPASAMLTIQRQVRGKVA